jgi:hypothetical protein
MKDKVDFKTTLSDQKELPAFIIQMVKASRQNCFSGNLLYY